MDTSRAVSRRDFLGRSGSLVVAFSLSFFRPTGAFPQDLPSAKGNATDQVDTFLAVDGRGVVTVYAGKVELGQGIRTAFTQIVADELDVAMDHVDVVQGDTALTPDQGPTYGSLAVQNAGVQIRQAAATARSALLDEAARRLGLAKEELVVSEGAVRAKAGGGAIAFADLVGGKRFTLKIDPSVSPKKPSEYRFVGKSVARLDIPAKLIGEFTYMHDYRVPGMLHGRVVRPPAIGANLESVDESSVAHISDLIKIVREGDFLGVVAANEWSAVRAARELIATWSKSETLPDERRLWEHVRTSRVLKDEITRNIGDSVAAMEAAGRKLSATYDFGIHTHGSIGPSCAISEFRDGKLISWSSSQATHNLRNQLALMFSMPPDDVRCVFVDGAGCYGRNGHEDAAADAALLARAVGRPVRVQWSRGDEHGWDPKGPPTLIDLRANVDRAGNVTAWQSEFFIPQGATGNVALVAADLSGKPAENALSPGGIVNDSAIGYRFPNVRTVCHRLESTPFRPSWIRAPGRLQNTFANECFIDEIASAVDADPIDFRIRYTDPFDLRGLEVLDRLAKLAKWEKRSSPQRTITGNVVKGRGSAYVRYELVRTYVGAVAEVEVDRITGGIKVAKFYVVHDCGQVINPGGVRAQIEGCVIQTTSRTLKEELSFDRAMVTSLDWATYPILTFPEVPEIEIELIDRPAEKPWGAGEPTAAVVSAAISNAVFDATGVRLRSVPFKPEKVRAALRAS